MTLRMSRPQPRTGRAIARSLLSATMLAGWAGLPAEAAKFPVAVTQVPDPFGTPPSIPDAAPTQGMWRGVFAWPLNAIHLGMLPTGKLVSFGSPPDNAAVQNGRYYDIWDPSKGFDPSGHTMLQGIPFVNSFCSTMAFLTDGSLLVSGGIFDGGVDKGAAVLNGAATGIAALPAMMAADRYYSTMLTLSDGRKLIMGGSYPYLGGWADPQGSIDKGYMTGMTPEVYNGSNWSSLFGANSRDAFGPENSRWWYPRAWVAPNGKVFGISAEKMWYLDPNGNGSVAVMPFKEPQRNASSATDAPNVGPSSTAVMYDTGRILQVGGNSYDNGNGFLASSRATLVDITGGNPVLTETAPTNLGRSWANSTVLPNGQVAVTGGSLWDDRAGNDAVLAMELWDPKTGKWTLGPAASVYRGYHSSALLLQNGTVMVSGGGAPGPVNNQNAEVYYPPYLFTSVDGKAALAPRPQILSLTTNRLNYGQSMQFELTSQNGLSQVVLLGVGLVTHSFNTTQRRMVLSATLNADSTVTAQAPGSANVAPPGYYQMVAIDQKGVPSPGIIVAIGPNTAAPPQATAPTPAATGTVAGNTGGTTGTGGTGGTGGSTGTGTGTGTASGGTGTAGTGPNLVGTMPLKASHSGMCLAVPAGNNNDGAAVTQQVCTGGQEQQWKFTAVSGGYTVVNASSGRCLDVSNASGAWLNSGTQVFSWSCTGGANQVWASKAQGSGVSLVSKNSNLCLDVYGGSTQAGAGTIQWTCSGAANQVFGAPTGTSPTTGTGTSPTTGTGTGTTSPTTSANTTPLKAAHSGLCLAVPAGNNNDGAPVTQQPCSGKPEQQWKFTAVSGGYTVVNAASGRCLDVAGVSQANGAQVWAWSCWGGANQVWASKAQGAGVALVSKNSNLCLDINGASALSGAGAIQWSCHGGANQSFIGPQAGS